MDVWTFTGEEADSKFAIAQFAVLKHFAKSALIHKLVRATVNGTSTSPTGSEAGKSIMTIKKNKFSNQIKTQKLINRYRCSFRFICGV